ncbi:MULTISPECIES: hypothetical protein [unclassified Akkermansia]|uniref:hypothetical protein n=1 Tax=unclassified Akkermansia TaxID=2608915 RepID=UPI000798469F|nr:MULTISPECIES: hypothetical protein [unclassified Akkermansia]KXT54899.1 hypothetical protein HMPREF3038_00176 [Akkermansia sp. KLE1797]KZA05815.1 hypothetical protein HMPREF1326_00479 [Akkermansia sp. KLE1605]
MSPPAGLFPILPPEYPSGRKNNAAPTEQHFRLFQRLPQDKAKAITERYSIKKQMVEP